MIGNYKMNNKIIVDIENPLDVSNALDTILNNLDDLCKNAIENNGVKYTNHEYTGMKYGKYEGKNFVEYKVELHTDMPSYSELAFFLNAAKESNNTDKILTFIKHIIQKNKTQKVWLDDEMPMGLNASFALAYNGKKYISNFIDFLRTTDMNHEVYQPIFIELLEKKWGICNETIELLAARSSSISGQWGVECHDTLDLSNEQKRYYLECLLKDTLFSKRIYPDILIEACQTLGISIHTDKFSKLFVNCGAYSTPTFETLELPSLIKQIL